MPHRSRPRRAPSARPPDHYNTRTRSPRRAPPFSTKSSCASARRFVFAARRFLFSNVGIRPRGLRARALLNLRRLAWRAVLGAGHAVVVPGMRSLRRGLRGGRDPSLNNRLACQGARKTAAQCVFAALASVLHIASSVRAQKSQCEPIHAASASISRCTYILASVLAGCKRRERVCALKAPLHTLQAASPRRVATPDQPLDAVDEQLQATDQPWRSTTKYECASSRRPKA